MVELSLPQLSAWLAAYLYPLFRLTAFFMAAPVFGTHLVPARIRIGLALLATILIVPLTPETPAIDPLSLYSVVMIAQQLIIGIAIAFVMQLFFHVFVLGAQMIAMQMALGLASMVDPANGISVTVLAQYFLLLLTLVFVAANGHLVMLEVLLQSFVWMPVGSSWLGSDAGWSIVSLGSWMFLSGLLLALPAVTALLVVNMAFGVMTRAAPQLNVFSLGFPVSMMFGLFIIWVGLHEFLPRYDLIAAQAFEMLRALLGAP